MRPFLTLYTALRILLQDTSSKVPHNRRNRHSQAQEIMGTSPRAGQSSPHERNNDVHVWQLVTDL